MSTPVLTISSRVPTEPYYFYKEFLASTRRHNIDPIFIPCHPYRGLMSKPKYLLKYLLENASIRAHRKIIVCDSWDIIFLTGADEVVYNAERFGNVIVFNAEKNCFPRADWAPMFNDSPTPYKYLNSGFFIGDPERIIAMLQDMKLEDIPDDTQDPATGKWTCHNDQEYYAKWYLEHNRAYHTALLDTTAILCQSLHDAGPNEFAFIPETQRVVSLLTKNQPCVIHGNGTGKEWLKRIIKWINL
jgi:hypothetical protein